MRWLHGVSVDGKTRKSVSTVNMFTRVEFINSSTI